MTAKKTVGNAQLMQKMNRLQVLDFIRNNAPVSRPAVAEATGLSLSSITNIVNYLMEQRVVAETGVENMSRVGRKATLLRFNGRAYRLICVYLEIEKLTVCCTDLTGVIYDKSSVSLPVFSGDENGSRQILQHIRGAVMPMLNRSREENILGIGIAVSGLVLEDSNYVLSISLRWKAYNVRRELEEYFNKPVFIENISITRAVWQLSHEKGIRERNIMFLDLDNGVGAVQFINGKLNRSLIGEIGHTTVERSGDLCFCGNHGCLEAMCSPERVVRLYREARPECPDADFADVVEACRRKDADAMRIVAECGEYLGIGLASVVNIFHPEKIILNSGTYAGCEEFFRAAIDCMKHRAYSELIRKLTVEQVYIDDNDSCRGIAVHLCDGVFESVFPL